MSEASPPPKHQPPPKEDGAIGGTLILLGGALLRVALSAVAAFFAYLLIALFGSFALDAPGASYGWLIVALLYGVPALLMLPSLLGVGAQLLSLIELARTRKKS